MSKLTENLQREIEENRALYGSKVALKQLKKEAVEKIYISNDCPPDIEEKIKAAKANIIKLEITKEMLKDLCKTPFNISVVSILKEAVTEQTGEKEDKKREKKSKKEEKEK